MGIMKRIQGWRDSRLPIPNTLQVLVGLIEPRDPEAYMERKRAARESARERRAIQEERPTTPKIAIVARGTPRVEAAVSEAAATVQRSEPSPIPGMRQGLLF